MRLGKGLVEGEEGKLLFSQAPGARCPLPHPRVLLEEALVFTQGHISGALRRAKL